MNRNDAFVGTIGALLSVTSVRLDAAAPRQASYPIPQAPQALVVSCSNDVQGALVMDLAAAVYVAVWKIRDAHWPTELDYRIEKMGREIGRGSVRRPGDLTIPANSSRNSNHSIVSPALAGLSTRLSFQIHVSPHPSPLASAILFNLIAEATMKVAYLVQTLPMLRPLTIRVPRGGDMYLFIRPTQGLGYHSLGTQEVRSALWYLTLYLYSTNRFLECDLVINRTPGGTQPPLRVGMIFIRGSYPNAGGEIVAQNLTLTQ